jgi:hypothetical protein
MTRHQTTLGAFQATQQVATAQICEAVADMRGDVLRQALAANPRKSPAIKQARRLSPEVMKEMEDTLRLL